MVCVTKTLYQGFVEYNVKLMLIQIENGNKN